MGVRQAIGSWLQQWAEDRMFQCGQHQHDNGDCSYFISWSDYTGRVLQVWCQADQLTVLSSEDDRVRHLHYSDPQLFQLLRHELAHHSYRL